MTIDDTIRSFIPMIRTIIRDRFGKVFNVSFDEMEAAALVAAWKAIEGYDAIRGLALSTYVHRCVHFALVDLLRREGVCRRPLRGRSRDVQLSAYDDGVFSAPEDCTVDGDDAVEAALQHLRPRTRDAVRLRMTGYTAVEAADKLGITANAVFWHMRQARKVLVA